MNVQSTIPVGSQNGYGPSHVSSGSSWGSRFSGPFVTGEAAWRHSPWPGRTWPAVSDSSFLRRCSRSPGGRWWRRTAPRTRRPSWAASCSRRAVRSASRCSPRRPASPPRSSSWSPSGAGRDESRHRHEGHHRPVRRRRRSSCSASGGRAGVPPRPGWAQPRRARARRRRLRRGRLCASSGSRTSSAAVTATTTTTASASAAASPRGPGGPGAAVPRPGRPAGRGRRTRPDRRRGLDRHARRRRLSRRARSRRCRRRESRARCPAARRSGRPSMGSTLRRRGLRVTGAVDLGQGPAAQNTSIAYVLDVSRQRRRRRWAVRRRQRRRPLQHHSRLRGRGSAEAPRGGRGRRHGRQGRRRHASTPEPAAIDLDPTSATATLVSPTADKDNNGVLDVVQGLKRLGVPRRHQLRPAGAHSVPAARHHGLAQPGDRVHVRRPGPSSSTATVPCIPPVTFHAFAVGSGSRCTSGRADRRAPASTSPPAVVAPAPTSRPSPTCPTSSRRSWAARSPR